MRAAGCKRNCTHFVDTVRSGNRRTQDLERTGGREGRAAGALELEQMGVSTGAAPPGPHAPLWPRGICWAGEGSQRQPGASWTASSLTGHRDGQGGGPHSALYPVTFCSNSRGQGGARPSCVVPRGVGASVCGASVWLCLGKSVWALGIWLSLAFRP